MQGDNLRTTIAGYLQRLGQVGSTANGLWRQPYTPDYERAVAMVQSWMSQRGLVVRIDDIGNVIGRVEGRNPHLKAVAVGSHLDTVKGGGNFDGALGVVGGLVAVGNLVQSLGAPLRSVEVIGFIGEEGSRFPGGFLGSKWMAGALGEAELRKTDEAGINVVQAMQACGYSACSASSSPRTDLECFIELHIEQGPVLETAGARLGVVLSIVGIRQALVTVKGRADHAGTTPLGLRQDALLASAQMIVDMDETVRQSGGQPVFTVGRLTTHPGATNVVAGDVTFTVDLRDPASDRLNGLYASLQETSRDVAEQKHVLVDWRETLAVQPVGCDPALTRVLAEAARELGSEPLEVVSGAGHDALVAASFSRIGMLFVPSRGGRSHCAEEYTTPEDCALGTAVLAHALRKLAWE